MGNEWSRTTITIVWCRLVLILPWQDFSQTNMKMVKLLYTHKRNSIYQVLLATIDTKISVSKCYLCEKKMDNQSVMENHMCVVHRRNINRLKMGQEMVIHSNPSRNHQTSQPTGITKMLVTAIHQRPGAAHLSLSLPHHAKYLVLASTV